MRAWVAAACAALLVVTAACGGGGGSSAGGGSDPGGGGGPVLPPPPPPPPPPPNTPPVADAGRDFTVSGTPQGYQLDGRGSYDPDGGALTYEWSIRSEPLNSQAVITGSDQDTATLQAIVPGIYVITLRVIDTLNAESTSTVSVTVTNDAPVVVAEVSLAVPVAGQEIFLDGTGSTDPNGHPLNYVWRLTNAPAGSNLVRVFPGAVVALAFDVEGQYNFSLEVSDGYDTAIAELQTITVSKYAVQRLSAPFRHIAEQPGGGVVAAVHDRTFMVIRDGEEAAVIALPQAATAVSVSPNGSLAAVAHSTSVSVIDLSANPVSVLSTVDAAVVLEGVAITDDGYIYSATSDGYSWRNSVVISPSGRVDIATTRMFHQGGHLKLKPSGGGIYFGSRNVTPDNVFRSQVNGADMSWFEASPYHGSYSFCGDLWIAADEHSMLTKCGVMLRLSDYPITDLTYLYQLYREAGAGLNVAEAAYSRFSNRWYVVHDGTFGLLDGDARTARSVYIYDAASGVQVGTLAMPLSANGRQLYAKWISPSQTDNFVRILAQDHETNPQEYYLLELLPPSTGALDYPPEMVVQKYSAGQVGRSISVDAGASFDPEGRSLSFSWALVGQPAQSSLILTDVSSPVMRFTPSVSGTYVFSVTGHDGRRESAPQNVIVNISPEGEAISYRIEGEVRDAEYSKTLNLLAYIAANGNELRLVRLNDFSETRIELPRSGYSVGISPDGRRAAVSHPGMASLINLETGAVITSREHSVDWGDIVLDRHGRAHTIANRDQWTGFISIDFATGAINDENWGSRAGSQLRLHPNGDWVYSAPRGSFPSYFEKRITTAFPPSPARRFPYHGDYEVGGDVWISETGTSLLAATGHLFNASTDTDVDMYYLDTLRDNPGVMWADHSSETGRWVVGSRGVDYLGRIVGRLFYYSDTDFERTNSVGLAQVPESGSRVDAGLPIRVFFSGDGETTFVLTENPALSDPVTLQIIRH